VTKKALYYMEAERKKKKKASTFPSKYSTKAGSAEKAERNKRRLLDDLVSITIRGGGAGGQRGKKKER